MPLLILVLGGMVLPFLLWNWLSGFATFLQHTHPRITWYCDREEWSFFRGQVQSAIHVMFPWPVGPILHNIMEHTAHHVDPSIPLYNLPCSQRHLEQSYSEDVIVEKFTIAYFVRVLAQCQLYDYRTRQWLNFEGSPMTAQMRG